MPIVDAAAPPSSPRGYDKEIVAITANATITENHRGRLLQVNSGSGVTLTLPRNLPVGFYFEWEQLGAGQVLFSAASGGTLAGNAASDRSTGQYARGECTVTGQAVNGLAAAWGLSGQVANSATVSVVASVSWAVAAGAANVCVFTGTLKDAAGETIAASRPLTVYLSEAATGIGITADSYSTGAAITTGTQLVAHTANAAWLINTHTDGTFAISITDSAKPADQYAAAIITSRAALSVSAASALLWGA
jgi:hypothetical protein